ncbi:MAG: methyltransferase domain-containing protein [Nitrospiraceae bacterium]|nr:methyltransferase domain-containing protein [Nitrospiraceae bacterium]
MDARTFSQFREFIYQKSGISLRAGKESLVSARMAKRMRALNIDTYKEYLNYVRADATGEELVQMIDAISTNVTSFYRESQHFEVLGSLLSKWYDGGQRRFRIWCAAASSGEEPYTLAITVREALAAGDVNARILATDISTRVLKKCLVGVYDDEKVAPVAPSLRDRYFTMKCEEGRRLCEVKPTLRQLLLFRRLNLSETPFPMKGPLDVIFCRNVMIYFDKVVRARLLAEFRRLLKPGGYLMVGHAESLTGMMSTFQSVQASVYVNVGHRKRHRALNGECER